MVFRSFGFKKVCIFSLDQSTLSCLIFIYLFGVQCSADCGLGERTRSVLCVNGDGKSVPLYHCRQQRPTATELCDMGSCAKGWYHTKWSKKVCSI